MCIIDVQGLFKTYTKEIKSKAGLLESFKNLFKREKMSVEALKGLSFKVKKGEMVAVVGPNGAGKTTLMKILAGILYPSSGKVRVLGFMPFEKRKEFLKRITFHNGGQPGFIAEATWDIPPLDAYSLLKDIYEIDERTYKKNLSFFVELLGMEKLVETPIRKLSTGERQKVEIIGALLHMPEVILFDEPTIGLDIVAQRKLRDVLKTFVKENNLTLLITSHYMRDIEDLGERIILLNKGEIIYDGTKEDIYHTYTSYRRIEIRFKDGIPATDFSKFGQVVCKTEHKVVINVRKNEAGKIAGYILKHYDVEDISFPETPLEDIISKLYGEVHHV